MLTLPVVCRSKQAAAAAHAVSIAANSAALQAAGVHGSEALLGVLGAARAQAESTAAAVQSSQPQIVHAAAAEAGRGRQWAADAAAVCSGEAVQGNAKAAALR